jgi:hypothetical protein
MTMAEHLAACTAAAKTVHPLAAAELQRESNTGVCVWADTPSTIRTRR